MARRFLTAVQTEAASASPILQQKLLAADANDSFHILGSGRHEWGAGGASAVDTYLYRSGASALATDGVFVAYQAAAQQVALGRTASGVAGAGITFGSAQDTNIYRSAANTLATDDALQVLGGNLTVGNYSAGVNVSIFSSGYNGVDTRVVSDTASAYSFFYRARGTSGTPTAVTNASYLGSFGFRGHDGSAFLSQDSARISAIATQDVSTTHGAAILFATVANGTAIGSGAAERMRIDQSGNVRIGSSATISSKLTFDAATTAAGGILFGSDTNLYRSAANTLMTDSALQALGSLTVGNGTAFRTATIVGTAFSGVSIDVYSNDTSAGLNYFRKARGTVGSPVATAANDYLGYFGFRSHTGSAWVSQDSARLEGIATQTTSTTHGGALVFRTAANGTAVASGPLERMRVDESGNVRIGSSATISSKLTFDAASTAAGGILFGSDTNLYRSAADTLRTDDSLSAGGSGAFATGLRATGIIMSPESSSTCVLPYFTNDLAYNRLRGGATRVYHDGVLQTGTDSNTDNLFTATSTVYGQNIAAITEIVIEIDMCVSLYYNTRIGFAVNELWRAKDVKLEIYKSAAWTTVADETNVAYGEKSWLYGGDATPFTKIRFTFKNFNTAGGFNLFRIGTIYTLNYSSAMGTGFFVTRDSGSIYGTLTIGNVPNTGTTALTVNPSFTGSGEGPRPVNVNPTFSPAANINGAYGIVNQPLASPGAGITVQNLYAEYIQARTGSTGGTVGGLIGAIIVSPSIGTVVPANVFGLDVQAQTGGSSASIGVRIAGSTTYSLQLSSTAGNPASGITFGTDTNLYRSAADTLKTDDSLSVVGIITSERASGAPDTAAAIQFTNGSDTTARFWVAISGKVEWGAGGSSARDTNLYRSTANTLKTDDDFHVGGLINVGADAILKREAAGVLAVRNSADSAYGIIRTATPSGANDAVPKTYADSAAATERRFSFFMS